MTISMGSELTPFLLLAAVTLAFILGWICKPLHDCSSPSTLFIIFGFGTLAALVFVLSFTDVRRTNSFIVHGFKTKMLRPIAASPGSISFEYKVSGEIASEKVKAEEADSGTENNSDKN